MDWAVIKVDENLSVCNAYFTVKASKRIIYRKDEECRIQGKTYSDCMRVRGTIYSHIVDGMIDGMTIREANCIRTKWREGYKKGDFGAPVLGRKSQFCGMIYGSTIENTFGFFIPAAYLIRDVEKTMGKKFELCPEIPY